MLQDCRETAPSLVVVPSGGGPQHQANFLARNSRKLSTSRDSTGCPVHPRRTSWTHTYPSLVRFSQLRLNSQNMKLPKRISLTCPVMTYLTRFFVKDKSVVYSNSSVRRVFSRVFHSVPEVRVRLRTDQKSISVNDFNKTRTSPYRRRKSRYRVYRLSCYSP